MITTLQPQRQQSIRQVMGLRIDLTKVQTLSLVGDGNLVRMALCRPTEHMPSMDQHVLFFTRLTAPYIRQKDGARKEISPSA